MAFSPIGRATLCLILMALWTCVTSQCTSTSCLNGGACEVTGNCTCSVGYAGDSCQTLTDTSPPILVCPNSFTVNNSDVARWQVPMATDESGEVYLLSSHSMGDVFPLGNTTVSYTARDRHGWEDTCSFVVEVVADGSPEITGCPDNQAITVAAGVTSSQVTWTEPTAIDPNGGQVTSSTTFDPGSDFALGVTLVTYSFTNSAGQTSCCSFKVEVYEQLDTVPPFILTPCPNDTITLVPPGTRQATVTWTEPTFSDLIDGNDLRISRSKVPGSSFSEGSTQVLYVAMDTNYNAVQCNFTITVNMTDDSTPPTIENCPSTIIEWVAVGNMQATVSWTPPTASDNYGTPTLETTHEPGSTFDLGTTVVTYTASDLVNNQAECVFGVTVLVDSESPVVTGCPTDIVEYVMPGASSKIVTWTSPTVTDNSAELTSAATVVSGSRFTASMTPRNDPVTLTYTDSVGNEDGCSFTVSVLIDTPPSFACPSVVSRPNIVGEAYANISWPEITVTDDYTPIESLQLTMTHTEPLIVQIGSPTPVTLSATDETGNVATCSFTATTDDVEAPEWIDCPADIIQPLDPGTNSAIVTWSDPTTSDNSGVDPAVSVNVSNPQLFSAGTYAVQYVATDQADNQAVCEFTVLVSVDSNVPVFDNCPVGTRAFEAEEGGSTAVVTWSTITATDDVDSAVTISSNYQPGETLAIGEYTVVYQAQDSNGNIGYCQFNVLVADLEPPVITSCPADQTLYILNVIRDVPVAWETPTAQDNSGTATVTQTTVYTSGSRFIAGDYSVVYVAEDSSGNFAECLFSITVQVKAETVSLSGELGLDEVRGFNGIFSNTQRRDLLEQDMDDLFRGTSIAADFVGVDITSSRFDSNGDLRVGYLLYLCASSHYNEEFIKDAFYSALSGDESNTFSSQNIIIADSFNLNVAEFRGEFTLRSIQSPGQAEVNFQDCCTDPDSSSYQDLVSRIQDHLDLTYSSDPTFKMSRVLLLSPGSVVVDYTLTYDPQDAPGALGVEQTFNGTVTSSTLELRPGVNTGLYLDTNGLTAGSTEAICGADYCLNGGTCSISDPETYEVECSCVSRYYGNRCQFQGLSWEVIVAIAIGCVVFLLLLILICLCCCYFFARSRYDAQTRRIKERRRRRRRKHRRLQEQKYQAAPLMLAPPPKAPLNKEDFQFSNGMFVNEVQVVNEIPSLGPSFKHEGKNGHAHVAAHDPALDPSSRRRTRRSRSPSPKRKMKSQKEKGPSFSHDQQGQAVQERMKMQGPVFSQQTHDVPQTKKAEKKRAVNRAKGPSFHAEQNQLR